MDGQILASKGFYTAERLAAMAAPFVQAQSGYFKIAEPERGQIIDDNWPVVPIVAWRIVGELDLAEPITPEMVSEVQHYVVLCPDGRAYNPGRPLVRNSTTRKLTPSLQHRELIALLAPMAGPTDSRGSN